MLNNQRFSDETDLILNPHLLGHHLETLTARIGCGFGQIVVYNATSRVVFHVNTHKDNSLLPPLHSVRRKKGNMSPWRVTQANDVWESEWSLGQAGKLYIHFEHSLPNALKIGAVVETLQHFSRTACLVAASILLVEERNRIIQDEIDKNKAKNELISIVSHDFRSPLTVINAHCELMTIQPNMTEAERNDHFDTIMEQVKYLRRLADSALRISRIESGELHYIQESFHFHKIIDRLKHRVSPDHPLHFEIENDLPMLFADVDRVFEILDNLLTNAVKYSPDGGEIRVKAINLGDRVEIRVRDHGIGVPNEQREKIFEKYFRVRDERSKRARGTGLGLYICRKLAEGMGGKIWLKRTAGQGATFVLQIPVKPQHAIVE